MAADVLPSSLARVSRQVQRSPYGNTAPVYCANCGQEWGRVVPELCTFAFVLCDGCAGTHGDPAGMMKEPDHVFWARHQQALEEMRGEDYDVSTLEGLAFALADESSPIAKVAKEWQAAFEKGSLR